MKKLICLALVLSGCSCNRTQDNNTMNNAWFYEPISDQSIKQLFPQSAEEINARAALLKKEVLSDVARIIAVTDTKRTFENTAQVFDIIEKKAQRVVGPTDVLVELSTEQIIRDTARACVLDLGMFFQKEVSKNVPLYRALKAYVDGNAQQEALTDEQRYYLSETIKAFEQSGLLLPAEQLEQVRTVSNEIDELEQQFAKTLNDINTKIPFSEQELAGVPAVVLKSLKKNEDGAYLVGLDYPTAAAVLKYAQVESTRKKFGQTFERRGYPENYDTLKKLISKRDQLAKLLKFDTYASCDLALQMAKKPETVDVFLTGLEKCAREKAACEIRELLSLPEAAGNPDGKIYPWNLAYLKERYINKFFNINSAQVAEYFPAPYVVEQILAVYSAFLGMRFEPCTLTGLWHESVRSFKVLDENNIVRGYLLMDLYPRQNKYGHAALLPTLSGVINNNTYEPAVAVLVANFSPGSADEPGLLTFDEVKTFFHEFGHCMHLIVSATHMFGFSGTHTKRDFVEVPSQMFEEWLHDSRVLKKLSKHYKTGASLPDETIKQLGALARFGIGDFVVRQAALSRLSLDFYSGPKHDIQKDYRDLFVRLRPYVVFDENARLPANWSHVASSGYGSKYYAYLWSKVFALDLFVAVRERGLFDPQVGKDLVNKVLSKGGSVEPAQLLQDFLGRPANQQAFLTYYGI